MVKPTSPGAPLNQPSSSFSLSQKKKKRKRKNKPKKNKQTLNEPLGTKKSSKFNNTMSAWAENFTAAATWQVKHQLAYWKSKAIALEYENKILHEIIQKNYVAEPTAPDSHDNNDSNSEQSEKDSKDHREESDTDFEASEELVEFLTKNAKFKEDARLEREKLKAKLEEENIVEEMDNSNQEENSEDTEQTHKKLYGDKWQSVMALETSVLTTFMNECDKAKPSFWPNIPFNFDFTR